MNNLRHPEFIEADIAMHITRLLERCRFRRPDVQVGRFDSILTLRIAGSILECEFSIRQYGVLVSAQ
jgi:hypothetical protein